VPLHPRHLGNPFHPIALDPAWLTPTVKALAQKLYDDRTFDRLPLLADELVKSGCADPEILKHLRVPEAHVRGCWALDLVLGKEWAYGRSRGLTFFSTGAGRESNLNQTLTFVDRAEPDEVLVLIRAFPNLITLGLSRRKNGDTEIAISPDECERVLEALRIAIVFTRKE